MLGLERITFNPHIMAGQTCIHGMRIPVSLETKEILQALPNLSISDRLKIAESALQLVLQEKHSLTKDEQKRQLTLAAMTAIRNYAPGSELDIFSDLEGKDFSDYPD